MPRKPLTVQKLIKKLQPIFNRYIRLRDLNEPCISCGRKVDWDETDAGHFWAKSGYNGLRFDEDNTHKECRRCNRFDESHLITYAENLEKKIGKERYIALKLKAQDYKRLGKKWTRQELRDLIDYYQEKLKEFE